MTTVTVKPHHVLALDTGTLVGGRGGLVVELEDDVAATLIRDGFAVDGAVDLGPKRPRRRDEEPLPEGGERLRALVGTRKRPRRAKD